ncbi:MAG: zinc ABC transporter substrate-binding protein [Deltaproteobacteria bacterium]|jgi:zinc transport system substrate-binding protein|nr:zinc ABC transporter substrate-binding protein [Deltaproteobacteria bacterium]MCW8893916.1 zinc ABC transporter substrate-binding protein [Deltaproteobacteria bacterium]
MKKITLLYLVLFCLSSGWSIASAGPRVVVSIKPLHSLVSGVMEGIGTPQLLVKGGGSPHGYILRPSEAQALARADLIVWVGPELESFLEKPLTTLAKKSQQLELAERLEEELLVKRHGESWEKPGHRHHAEAADDGHQTNVQADLHLWLDPALAKKIVALTANKLAEIDPAQSARYQTNKTRVLAKIDRLDRQLREQLNPVKEIPYIVFHAAYQYFESAYGLNAVGSVTIDPERQPGAKRIREIRAKINELNARCVFSEPQFESRLVATILEGTETRTGILDPLGADIEEGPDAYFLLLQRMADNLVKGLR